MTKKILTLLTICFVYFSANATIKNYDINCIACAGGAPFLYVGDTLIVKYTLGDNKENNVTLLTKDSLFIYGGCATNYDGINPSLLAPFEFPFFGNNFSNSFYNIRSIDSVTSIIVPYQVPPYCSNRMFGLAWNRGVLGCGSVVGLVNITPIKMKVPSISCTPSFPILINPNIYIADYFTHFKAYIIDTLRVNDRVFLSDYLGIQVNWGDGSPIDTIIDEFGNLGNFDLIDPKLFILNKPTFPGDPPPFASLFSHTYTISTSTTYSTTNLITAKYVCNYKRCLPFLASFDWPHSDMRQYCLPTQTLTLPSTNINNIKNENIEVYPNPVNEKLIFKNFQNIERVDIFNYLGDNVKSIDDHLDYVDLTDIKDGIYSIIIKTKEFVYTKKIIKNH